MYKKIKKYTKKSNIITILVALLLFINIPYVIQTKNVKAQSEDITSKLDDTKATVEQITKIKDSDATDEEKTNSEIELKKKVLINIIELGQLQISNLRKKLDSVSFPDTDDWNSIKDMLYSKIEKSSGYYDNVKYKIVKNSDITLQDIKDYAKKIEQEKINNIDPQTQEINDVIITFSISDILSLADNRLEKINSDVTKIYTQKLTNDNNIKDMFFKSSNTLNDAHEINNIAKETILNTYSIEIFDENSTTSTSTATTTIDIPSTIKERKDSISKLTDKLRLDWINENTETTSTSTIKDDATPTNRKLIDGHIRSLILSSLNYVKKTYSIFINMSINASKLLNKK